MNEQLSFSRLSNFAAFLILSAVILVAYHPAIFHALVFDDLYFVDDILRTESFLEFAKRKLFFPGAVFRPLPHLVWYWPIQLFFGTDAWKYQLLTVFGHIAVAFIVFRIGVLIEGSRRTPVPFLTAVLFGFNAIYSVESIWFTGFFEGVTGILLALLAAALRLRPIPGRWKQIAACMLFFILALLSYEPAVCIGAIIVIGGWIADSRAKVDTRGKLAGALPFVLVAFTFLYLKQVLFVTDYGAEYRYKLGLHALENLWNLLSHLLLPRNAVISSDPYTSNVTWFESAGQVVLGNVLAGVVAAGLTVYVSIFRSVWNMFFFVWVFVGLVPFLPVSVDVDPRWTYLSSVGVTALFASVWGTAFGAARTRFAAGAAMALYLGAAAYGCYKTCRSLDDVGQRGDRKRLIATLRESRFIPGDQLFFISTVPRSFLKAYVRDALGAPVFDTIEIIDLGVSHSPPHVDPAKRQFLYVPAQFDSRRDLFVPLAEGLIVTGESGRLEVRNE